MSMLNQLTGATPVDIVQSDTTTYLPEPLKAIDIFAPGDIKVDIGDITARTFTFPSVGNGGNYPFRWWCMSVSKVYATDTTIADANLFGWK